MILMSSAAITYVNAVKDEADIRHDKEVRKFRRNFSNYISAYIYTLLMLWSINLIQFALVNIGEDETVEILKPIAGVLSREGPVNYTF